MNWAWFPKTKEASLLRSFIIIGKIYEIINITVAPQIESTFKSKIGYMNFRLREAFNNIFTGVRKDL